MEGRGADREGERKGMSGEGGRTGKGRGRGEGGGRSVTWFSHSITIQ